MYITVEPRSINNISNNELRGVTSLVFSCSWYIYCWNNTKEHYLRISNGLVLFTKLTYCIHKSQYNSSAIGIFLQLRKVDYTILGYTC